ncbi:MAG: 50S ribosomal protein L6 [Candidatus Harrisonbacteria bacterium CG10_big_fil_rev_8_21_14_0_10_40_38]|uniref:50S ribosomal protein L6 n=1 Tax=Candidatus Harrisonbacteria bacterium CG10_big_fil_rev_8_21_14_0_10_40_38 TaxID=1974583 RepID=A0A2H0UUM7_9BACT|nr:MAG: 50S ribosomal protein L6 [Candidatus Harrisonbacteria bacterium CG10_big_fil_rev_8_21_14_0_10_40_38]
MSKIAKKPIEVPSGVNVSIKEHEIEVTGKGGTLIVPLLSNINAVAGEEGITLTPKNKIAETRANWGTVASLLKNATQGVSEGFTKSLEIEGIGFKAVMEGKTLVLNVGFSHQVKFPTPSDVTITVEKNIIKVSGIDKERVGQTAAEIRKIKKPEPYKGKGIHYVGEVVRRKAGKKVAGSGGGS